MKDRQTALQQLLLPCVIHRWIHHLGALNMKLCKIFKDTMIYYTVCPTTGFQWSGCSDNLSYGVAFSQTFVDEPERAKGLSAGRPLMNLHNNEAGRKVGGSNLTASHLISKWAYLYIHDPLIFRPSFTTCRWNVSVMASLARVS